MDFSVEISHFVSGKIGGIVIISQGSGNIEYTDEYINNMYKCDIVGKDSEEVLMWTMDCPPLSDEGEMAEWEFIDTDTKKYYKVNSSVFEKEEKKYVIHMLTDISEYMGLNRDVTKYMAFFKKLSAFQSSILEKLSDSLYELLPMLSDYLKTPKAYLAIKGEDFIDIISYVKIGNSFCNDRIDITEESLRLFEMGTEDDVMISTFSESVQNVFKGTGSGEDSSFRMLCEGEVSDQKYAIYFPVWPNMDKESMSEKTLISVIKLYVENGIMRDKLLYESEHDALTGLYNKGKYLSMVEQEYTNMDSIGIFNLDVNNLKILNDTCGHEMGDRLLIKAADSIRKVTTNTIHGYRMGGDEFLMILCNPTKDDVYNIKAKWEKELARLNEADKSIECIIAAGIVYAEKEYNYDMLMQQADKLMYEDKKSKKKPGEEIR